jgi:hypothetical protein
VDRSRKWQGIRPDYDFGRVWLVDVRRWAIVAGLAVLVSAAALYLGTRLRTDQGDGSPTSRRDNPFGIFLHPRMFGIEDRVRLARELGARYFRSYPVLVPAWDGQCSECALVHEAGLEFVLTIRNSSTIETPAAPVTDLAAYRQVVGEAIDLYEPSVVVIENEEETEHFYSGTAEQYSDQLRAGCEAAHERGVPCANGGLLSGSVTYLVYQHYVDTGQEDAARSFVDRAWENWQRRNLDSPEGLAHVRFIVDHVTEFLSTYRDAGADYVNFHWYQSDARALEEAVSYLEELTGLPAMTNELGQRNLEAAATTQIVEEVLDLGLPFAVWYSSDSRLAQSLVDRSGALRETGEAFRSAVEESVP